MLDLLTVEELKVGLRYEMLAVSGLKRDLVARLAMRLATEDRSDHRVLPTIKQMKYVLYLWRARDLSGISIWELSRGRLGKSLQMAQRALLPLDKNPSMGRSPLWELDFLIPAISVDDWLGGCAAAAQAAPPNRNVSTAVAWSQRFAAQLRRPPQQPPPSLDGSLAFATLLSDEVADSGRFTDWLRALDVMTWSLRRFHGVEGKDGQSRQLLPLLVLCQAEMQHQTRPLLEERGLIPFPVAALPAAPLPGDRHLAAAWRRLHLWRLTSYRRIVYLDTDTLVTGSLWHLFQLPGSVHLAASGFGLDHQLLRHQRMNTGVMVLTPSQEVFRTMSIVLESGLLHEHPELQLQGYLDQAWVDLFFRYVSRHARGGLIRWRKVEAGRGNLSAFDVCPPPEGAEDPPEVKARPLSTLPGSGSLDLNVCMLDPGSNFLVAFGALNTCSDEVLEFCHAGLAVPKARGIRVLHWPGGTWKPWTRRAPLSRSVADELWWSIDDLLRSKTTKSFGTLRFTV
eukprot:s1511_g3.t1